MQTKDEVISFLDGLLVPVRPLGYSESTCDYLSTKMLNPAMALCSTIVVRRKADGTELERRGTTYLLRKGAEDSSVDGDRLRQAVLRREPAVAMRFLQTFQFYDFLDTFVSLTVAFVCGTLIGAERQYRQRSAGLRTNVLVAVGAAAFVDLANQLSGADGSVRVISYVVSGIGFLGAGAIMKEGMSVRGLNTAATLWASAAVGSCAGADMIAQAGLLTIFVLAGNTLLRPLVNAIDRFPLSERASEATYQVSVTTDANSIMVVRDALLLKLELAKYPVREAKEIQRADNSIEVTATLVSLAVEPEELDAVVAESSKLPEVHHAAWDVRTVD